jgi:PhzF family phenazine biosynthesis protein
MPSLDYRVVDAFSAIPFQGNPAAVVLGGDELTDGQMQQLAAEFNLSETVFVLRPSSPGPATGVRLRWFTPLCEEAFCGHATLAAIHTVCERSQAEADIAVECAAGNLRVRVEPTGPAGQRYWLSMPAPGLAESQLPHERLLAILGVSGDPDSVGPIFRTRDRDVIVLLNSGRQLRSLAPDMVALARFQHEHAVRGACVATTDTGRSDIACISRFFAPGDGVAEDPVTGSVHGPLAALLIRTGRVAPVASGRWAFDCQQVPGNGRLGVVYIRAESRGEDPSIEIGGSCVTVMSGRLSL